ncbi:hypothetical protein [Ancylobacter novellus]|uniref:hypothetical protein n=1 Tax=Ancylobacter novellus TaxID=921 RepID=UPI00165118FB|nr:hypothetical protein [Ancylobacter novellus]
MSVSLAPELTAGMALEFQGVGLIREVHGNVAEAADQLHRSAWGAGWIEPAAL